MSDVPVQAWVCSVCGYIHYGPTPPQECPVCGVDGSQFELNTVAEPSGEAVPVAGEGIKIVIAGAGIAGISAAEAARKAAPLAEIWLLSNETDLTYYRLNLTRYLAGEIDARQLELHPESWYVDQRIQLLRGVELTAIDPGGKTLTLNNGEALVYDRLVLTTGARPFVPPLPGTQLANVVTLRTRRDADTLLQDCCGKTVICVGGGLLGLETAGALARQGIAVTVLENQPWLMPRQLNLQAATLFQLLVEGLGIAVRTGAKVRELQGNGAVQAVVFEDGDSLPANLVVFSAGVRANTSLAAQAGLRVNQGIVVDDAMRTSNPDIFAAGDAAEHAGVLYGTWAPAQAQGSVAGSSAAGQVNAFNPLPRSNVLKALGIDLFSIGRITPQAGDVLIEETTDSSYHGLVFQGGVLVGAILLGEASAAGALKQAVEHRLDCADLLAHSPSAREVIEQLKSSRQ